MPNFKGGDRVVAAADIYLTERDGTPTDYVLAHEGDSMVVRSSQPLEVSAWSNPLISFEVKSHQIRPE
jgi:hypothetical protein